MSLQNTTLESYFSKFKKQIIGDDLTHNFDNQVRPVIYADWTASGRLYAPIEDYISNTLGPYVANTHTEATLTGTTMTLAYHEAQQTIKKHVNASENDVLIMDGSGMTGVVNKFQRILGLRIPERFKDNAFENEDDKPLVIVTHMEHHSNQTSWLACEVTLEILNADVDGLPSLTHLGELLTKYKSRKMKIGAFSACSNVTGIVTNYYQMAELMHQHQGLCFVDFAASAPYLNINMHPANPLQELDAIFFSPHKFLGGPGASGALIFNKSLYNNEVPDNPGGGTVLWTNPWGEHKFFDNIEVREDGGTPGFLQCIRTALAIKLKEAMGVEKMANREKQLTQILMNGFDSIDNLMMLETHQRHRLTIVSFYMTDIHHNLVVRLLNDKFGIQTRGGCSCAGTYGHILLGVTKETSNEISDKINQGDLTDKPGWIRVSLHPTTSDSEAEFIVQAMKEIVANHQTWALDYQFNSSNGEFEPKYRSEQYVGLDGFDACPVD
ncbi:MAG: selenocysteine lyase [Gammaproteobacteria bacterium]|nr:MAG: selenocysteine lyase [Gammaproteobacteria bacterium]